MMTFEIYVNSSIFCVLLQVQYNKFYMVHFKMNHLNLRMDQQSKFY